MNSTFYFRALSCATVLTLGFPLLAAAQTPGTVTGTLQDGATQQALPFANVVLLRAQDSVLATGTATAENGRFRLEKVAPGKYTLRATVLGYQAMRRPVVVGPDGAEVALGAVVLKPLVTELKGVTVTGEKAAVQESLDKKVINVEKDLSSVGGTAVNVLQNVPSVQVGADGTVSMRGSSNITVLIDGKPANGYGNRLEQIPASSIEKVEVVTNPSAKYEASGGGGVINIILKKQKKDGWNGQASLLVGTRDKYNGNLSLNRRAGKLNVFASADARDMEFRSSNWTDQTFTAEGQRNDTYQRGASLRYNKNYSGRAGFDLNLPANQSLTVALESELNRSRNAGTQEATVRNSAGIQQINSAFNSPENVDQLNLTTDYRRTWDAHKGRELTASLRVMRLNADVMVANRNTEGAADLLEWQQDIAVDGNFVNGQVDYVHPLAKKGRLDLGLRSQWQNNGGTYDYLREQVDGPGFDRLADRSYFYDFTEHVQAGYATYQQEWGKWSAQGGLRAEYTNTQGDVLRGEPGSQSGPFRLEYLNLFPSATVARNIDKYGQRVQVSYSRRLNRPGFMQLLAFPLWQDQRSYRIGDPTLRPEYINALELGHQLTLGQANISSTVFYRQTTNAMQRLTEVDNEATARYGNGAIITGQYARNFGQAYSYGAELSVNQPVAKWWRVTANGSLFERSVTGATGNESSRRLLTGTVRVMNSFTPTPKLDLQLTGNFRAASITPQGRTAPVGSVDLALRQRLFNDRGALTLRVSDIFDTQFNRTEAFVETPTSVYNLESYNKWESRVAYLGFSWYMGKNKPPKRIEQAPQGGGGGFGG